MGRRRKRSNLGPCVAELRPNALVVVVVMVLSMLLLVGGVAAGLWALEQSPESSVTPRTRSLLIVLAIALFVLVAAPMVFKICSVGMGRECIRLHANGMVFRGTFSKRAFLWLDVKSFLHVNEHIEDPNTNITSYRYWWRLELHPNTTLDLHPGLYGKRFDELMERAQQLFEQERREWNLRYGPR